MVKEKKRKKQIGIVINFVTRNTLENQTCHPR